jgi:hypothetical protein
MLKSIEIVRKSRLTILNLVKDLSIEQLNHIPRGFNNNIIWNIAHLISAQQGTCYQRAGLNIIIDDKYYTPYRLGTKPEKFVDADEVAIIKELFLSTIDQLETDSQNNIFTNYTTWTTRYGLEVTSFTDAISLLPFHEGLHHGCIIAQKKLVLKES